MATLRPNRFANPSPDMRRLLRLLSHAEEVADAIAQAMVSRTTTATTLALPSAHTPVPPRRRPVFDDARWKELARPGIGSIVFRPVARGSYVSIDGAEEFLLPTKAAGLLHALAHREGPSNDGFVPWASLAELAAERGCSRHAMTVAIGRLRHALLSKGNKSPFLVETRRGAVRVRLRRSATTRPPGSE